MAGSAHSYVDLATGSVHLTLRGLDEGFADLLGAARSNPRDGTFKTGLFNYAWEAHRNVVIHEWGHVLQLVSYPLLLLRAARAGRVMAGPSIYMANHPGYYPLPLRFEMDERWRLSTMLGTIGFRATVADDAVGLSPVEGSTARRGVLTERDLLEEDATVFQFRAEISGAGTGKAYRRWLRERPRYTRLFSFLATHFGDDAALRLLPILVRIAYRTTRPIEAFFRSFGTLKLEGLHDDPTLDDTLEEVLFSNLREPMGTVEARDLTMGTPELDDPEGLIEDAAFDELAARYPQLPIAPLTRINLHGSEEQRGVVNQALRDPGSFFNRWTRAFDNRLLDYLPPAITVALDDPDFPFGSSLLFISPLLGQTEFPQIAGVTYADWMNPVLKGRMVWRAIADAAAGPNTRCPHTTCSYHPTGLCRGWMTVPASADDCEFPRFLASTTKHQLGADANVLEPVTP